MKNHFLIASMLFFIPSIFGASDVKFPVYKVSRETFILLNDAVQFLKNNPDYADFAKINFSIDQFNETAIIDELVKIYNILSPEDGIKKNTMSAAGWAKAIVRYGKFELKLGRTYDNSTGELIYFYQSNPTLNLTPILHEDAAPSRFTSIINSSLFKSSCAATITGLGTYFAIGFYNKGKKKEEQLSQKKWALGAAAVAGIGTFAYVYLSAPAELNDDFKIIE